MTDIISELIKREVYLEYSFEQVMVRTVPPKKKEDVKYFMKFYGKEEQEIKKNHIMLNEVLRFGDEITQKEYEKMKPFNA